MRKTSKLTLLALFISLALILSIIDNWITPFIFFGFVIPGIKPGLSNIVIIIVLLFFGYKEALVVVLIRCLLAAFLAGTFIMFIFSISGGILSTTVMAFMFRFFKKHLSIVSISVAGSIVHNIGQIMAAYFIMNETYVFTYFPVLLVSGVIMGSIVGITATFLNKALSNTGIFPKREVD